MTRKITHGYFIPSLDWVSVVGAWPQCPLAKMLVSKTNYQGTSYENNGLTLSRLVEDSLSLKDSHISPIAQRVGKLIVYYVDRVSENKRLECACHNSMCL